MRIFVCLFMVITKIDYSVSEKFCLIGKSSERWKCRIISTFHKKLLA